MLLLMYVLHYSVAVHEGEAVSDWSNPEKDVTDTDLPYKVNISDIYMYILVVKHIINCYGNYLSASPFFICI